jgi:hypothetical protein
MMRRARSSANANNKALLLIRKTINGKYILLRRILVLRDPEKKALYLVSLIKLIHIH